MAVSQNKLRVKEYQVLGTSPRWYDRLIPNDVAHEEALKEARAAICQGEIAPPTIIQDNWERFLKGPRRPNLMQSLHYNDLGEIFNAFRYGMHAIWHGHRWKTALMTGLCLLGGAALGWALGVFGTVLLGAGLGAFAVLAPLGVIGLTIVGALMGKRLGKKISGAFFKRENQYELSPKTFSAWEAVYEWDSKALLLKMNAYLLNRENRVQAKILKRNYNALRRKAIKKADPTAVEKLTRFFCQELVLLDQARTKAEGEETVAWKKDWDFVIEVLNAFRWDADLSPGISDQSIARIQEVLAQYTLSKGLEEAAPRKDLETGPEHFIISYERGFEVSSENDENNNDDRNNRNICFRNRLEKN